MHGSIARCVRRLLPSAAALVAAATVAGCYATLPLASDASASGRSVQLELNDQGRAALGPQLGPEVRYVEGRLQAATDAAYVVRVDRIVGFDNIPQTWAGESLLVQRPFVRTAAERRIDPVKTSLVAGGLVAAVVGFFITRSLTGAGAESTTRPPPVNGQ